MKDVELWLFAAIVVLGCGWWVASCGHCLTHANDLRCVGFFSAGAR